MGKKTEKVAVIGAGISGLTAGIYGRLAGYDVEIYEKNAVPGGECTGWDRGGFHIDNCIHWLNGTKQKSELNDLWRTTRAVPESHGIHGFDFMYRSELNGQSVTLWKDLDRTTEELIEVSAEDEAEIRSLMESCRLARNVEIPVAFPPEQWGILYALRMLGGSKGLFTLMAKYKGMDTQDLMNRFRHPLIRAMLRDFCTKESLAYSFPLAYGNFLGGDGGIPSGGSRSMALRMAERFTDLGGKLFLSSPVAKLITEGGRVTALELPDGRLAAADWFVPACDAAYTFGTLLDPSYADQVFKDFWSHPEAYPVYGTFQAAVSVDSGQDLPGGDVNLDISDLSSEEWMGDRMSVKTYAYEPSFAPAGKQILQILCGGTSQAYDYFKKLHDTDKAGYREKKDEIARRLLGRIEERWPEYAGKLSILDIWTPVTYGRYCNAYRGYYQACTIGKKAGKKTAPSPFVRGLQNVVLAGQWLSPPGGLPGAAAAGKYAIQRIRRKGRFNRIDAERIALMAAGVLAALYRFYVVATR